jgi:subfamily B ATP-binding cassette protein MsbA
MNKQYKKAFIKYVTPYKKYAAFNIISNIFYAMFSTLAFLVFIPLLKVLFSEDIHKTVSKPQWSGIEHAKDYYAQLLNYHWLDYINIHGQKQALTLVIILVISIVFLKNLFNYLALFFMTFLRNGMLKDMRNDMYDKVLSLPIPFFSERKKGDVIARMTSDVNEVQNAAMVVLEIIVREPLTILFTIITMWIMNYKLTLFVFIFTPFAGYIISAIGKQLKKSSHLVQRENSNFLSLIEETLTGLKIIKGFNAEPIFSHKFKHITQNIYRYANSMVNRQNLAHPASEFLGILVIVAIVWYGGQLVLDEKSLSPAVFISFIALAYNVLTPAKAIAKASYAIQKGMASVERIFNILDAKSPLEDKPEAKNKKSFEEKISFENVSFKYELDEVLKNVSFNIKKGQMVALVGQSGSGKSTIANLLMRFYDVTKGAIKIDGMDIRDITKKSLRELMGLVTQDSILFNDTVKNNIALGKPEASMDEIINAAKIANAHDFIMELPKGYDTNIGDSGNKLSGGQKQRLNIARAILKNPPVMVMDEATSALDTESEKLVQDALDKLMKDRTSIVIAHRLSTIKNADKIIVLHKGEIIEIGNHKELMNKKGTYHNLIMLQSFE